LLVFIRGRQPKSSILKTESLERLIVLKRGDDNEIVLGFDFDTPSNAKSLKRRVLLQHSRNVDMKGRKT
jgi:hypothetical protein